MKGAGSRARDESHPRDPGGGTVPRKSMQRRLKMYQFSVLDIQLCIIRSPSDRMLECFVLLCGAEGPKAGEDLEPQTASLLLLLVPVA
jgi:hypothetical protein